jgi:hypothetical protein
LDVGADRIARTALSALSINNELGALTNSKIRLAWNPKLMHGIYSIEVYPAGTLRSYERIGYVTASKDSVANKRKLISKMISKGKIIFEADTRNAISNEHVMDSVLCTVAATDFLEGHAITPASTKDKAFARKEGWIWVANPNLMT